MKNYFNQMEPWARNDGALHLYVLPSDDERERLVALQEHLEGIDGLPLMPGPNLHLTLQKLAHFDDEVTQRQLSALGVALDTALAAVPAFTLDLGSPTVGAAAVTCEAGNSPAWDRLSAAVRSGLQEVLGTDRALPEPPHGAHVTLSYATGEVSEGIVAARLADAPPTGSLVVDEVHLVSVTVRPEVGTFDFTHLAGWDLAHR